MAKSDGQEREGDGKIRYALKGSVSVTEEGMTLKMRVADWNLVYEFMAELLTDEDSFHSILHGYVSKAMAEVIERSMSSAFEKLVQEFLASEEGREYLESIVYGDETDHS